MEATQNNQGVCVAKWRRFSRVDPDSSAHGSSCTTFHYQHIVSGFFFQYNVTSRLPCTDTQPTFIQCIYKFNRIINYTVMPVLGYI